MARHHPLPVLLVLSTWMVCLHITSAAATASYYRDCWLLFGGVDDIGYSHSMNLGRLEINRRLGALYPNTQFESTAYSGVFFKSKEDREILVNQTIADGCHLIVSGSASLFDTLAYAREFPNISFVGGAGQEGIESPPRNLALWGLDWFDAAFVSGAVAASVSETCAGFINAFEAQRATWNHAMGFALGYRWIKPHQPIHIVTMNSYFNPDAEVLAAQQLVDKGCDVIARHTDPNTVDKYIKNLKPTQTNGRRVLSMARYVDMSTFVGDSVFTSQVWNAFDVFYPLLLDSFQTSNGTFSNTSKEVLLGKTMAQMHLSPFTSAENQTKAAHYEKQAWDYLNAGNNPTCNYSQWRTPTTATNKEECWDKTKIPPSYLLLPNVSYYDAFQDGGAICQQQEGSSGGGHYYIYHDNLTVSCHPCPIHTYASNDTRAPPEGGCNPCPIDTVAPEPGSAQCTTLEVTANTPVVIGVSVSAVIAVLLVLLGSYILMKRRHKRDNTFAPKQPHLAPGIAVLFTDIQASTTLWANAPQEMSRAVEAHHELLRRIIKRHQGYEVKTIGDAFMVAVDSVDREDTTSGISKAVAIALDIQRELYHHDWETTVLDEIYFKMSKTKTAETMDSSFSRKCWNGLRIRVGIAYGTCDGQKDAVTGGWDYYGTTVNTAARVEAAAHGGQVLMTGPAYTALKKDNNQHETLSDRMKKELGIESVKSHGAVPLRGLGEPVELLELTPIGALSNRQFPPLRVEEPEVENGVSIGLVPEDEDPSENKDGSTTHHSDTETTLSPEHQLERLMKTALRMTGIRRYNKPLLDASWNIYNSTKALLSLISEDERDTLLTKLVEKWHVSAPDLDEKVLKKVGNDAPKLLVLAIRAATVVLADQHSFLAFKSFRTDTADTGMEHLLEHDEEEKDD